MIVSDSAVLIGSVSKGNIFFYKVKPRSIEGVEGVSARYVSCLRLNFQRNNFTRAEIRNYIFFGGGKYLSLHLLETLETLKSKNHKTNSINKYSDTFVLSEIPQLCYTERSKLSNPWRDSLKTSTWQAFCRHANVVSWSGGYNLRLCIMLLL